VFKVILEASDDGGVTATVSDAPGYISEGDTVRPARANSWEAMKVCLRVPGEPSAAGDRLGRGKSCSGCGSSS